MKGLDDYATHYSIYILPESVEDMLRQGSWDFLRDTPMDSVGQIRIDAVKFDQSRRKELDASFLDSFVAEYLNLLLGFYLATLARSKGNHATLP